MNINDQKQISNWELLRVEKEIKEHSLTLFVHLIVFTSASFSSCASSIIKSVQEGDFDFIDVSSSGVCKDKMIISCF